MPGEMDDLSTREDLAGLRARLQASGDVQSSPAIPTLDGHRLSGVEADAHGERQGWIRGGLIHETLLQSHGGSDRGARRAEDGQDLVSPQFDHPPAVVLDDLAYHFGETSSELRGDLVPMLLREGCPAAHVADQERMDVGVFVGARSRLRFTARPAHRRRPAIRRNTHAPSINPFRGRRERARGSQLMCAGPKRQWTWSEGRIRPATIRAGRSVRSGRAVGRAASPPSEAGSRGCRRRPCDSGGARRNRSIDERGSTPRPRGR